LRPGLESASNLFDFKHFHHIPGFDILKILQAYTTLIPRHHFPHVILEALQTGHAALIHSCVVPEETHLRTTGHFSFFDEATGHYPNPGNGEDLPHLNPAPRSLT
jgi:hypothetical protein